MVLNLNYSLLKIIYLILVSKKMNGYGKYWMFLYIFYCILIFLFSIYFKY